MFHYAIWHYVKIKYSPTPYTNTVQLLIQIHLNSLYEYRKNVFYKSVMEYSIKVEERNK